MGVAPPPNRDEPKAGRPELPHLVRTRRDGGVGRSEPRKTRKARKRVLCPETGWSSSFRCAHARIDRVLALRLTARSVRVFRVFRGRESYPGDASPPGKTARWPAN